MESIFLTDKGRVRTLNEDSGGIFYNQQEQMLAVVADGMGGHRAGDVASLMAVQYMQDEWEKACGFKTPKEIEAWLDEHIDKMNKNIFNHANQTPECFGMGTTIVIVACIEEMLTVAHVGDSRCYFNHQDRFTQITEDHSLVNELVRTGQLKKEDAKFHPRKNVVLKAVGTNESVKPDIQSLEWEKNDSLLICSDGLTDKLSDTTIQDYLNLSVSIFEKGNRMITEANDRGGEDNISLLIIRNGEQVDGGAESC